MSANPYTLYRGDCLEVLRTLPDNSVDAIVTDPPYGLSSEPDMNEVLRHWLAGDDYHHKGAGFMGKSWDSFVPGPAVWREALRVLKPGGYLLAFFGTRTQDIGTLAIRLAGFEIRDCIDRWHDGAEDVELFINSLNPAQCDAFLRLQDQGDARMSWTYGSGFPKSMDVSKAIDKARHDNSDWRRLGVWLKTRRNDVQMTARELCAAIGTHGERNNGGAVSNWELGLSCPTWDQWLGMKAVLRFTDEMDAEVWRLNGRKGTPGNEREILCERPAYGIGGNSTYNGHTDGATAKTTAPATDAARQWAGFGTALKPAHEPICVARKPLVGTVAANVLAFGTGALNIDGCRVETNEDLNGGAYAKEGHRASSGSLNPSGMNVAGKTVGKEFKQPTGRWPANIIHDGSAAVVAMFPREAGASAPVRGTEASPASAGHITGERARVAGAFHADKGSAARFFYCAKASKTDRDEGLDAFAEQITDVLAGHRSRRMEEIKRPDGAEPARGKNHHPTVKPTDLMAYLVRLVTPPGGVVLDMYMGSGTTGKACMREGFTFIGIDKDVDEHGNPLGYLEIAAARIEHELAQVAIAAEQAKLDAAQLDLFAGTAA